MTNSEINHNTLSGFDHGIEYYADQNYNRATKIRKNKITGGTSSNKTGHGIVVAPIKDPVGASTGENNSQNTINLKIRCNKIWYNELGIVGSGYLIDQISSTQPAGNMFNDPANSSSDSRNSQWDILWRNRFTSTDWDYYYSNAYYQPNSNMPNPNTAYDPKLLNGASIGGSQNATQVDDSKNNGINYLGCYGTWKRNPFSTGKQEVQNQPIQVYPNPVQDEVTIQTPDIGNGQIQVMDMTGQIILTDRIQGSPQTLNTENWETGTYLIRVTSLQGNTFTKKLLKVSQ
jgi:hypothetical protein